MYGRCYDGHIHRIKTEYENIATDKKQNFKSFMFVSSALKKTDIPNLRSDKFKSLPARNCPNSVFFHTKVSNPSDRGSRLYQDDIRPYEGEIDSRTGAQFLAVFENHVDRSCDISSRTSKQKLFYLIKHVIELTFEDITLIRYENLREEFLDKFWNLKQQYKVYSDFLRSSYPLYQGQKVSAYVNLWINRFGNNTIILWSDFLDSLINRIPVRYGIYILRKSCSGIEPQEIYDLVKACESDLSLIEKKDAFVGSN